MWGCGLIELVELIDGNCFQQLENNIYYGPSVTQEIKKENDRLWEVQ